MVIRLGTKQDMRQLLRLVRRDPTAKGKLTRSILTKAIAEGRLLIAETARLPVAALIIDKSQPNTLTITNLILPAENSRKETVGMIVDTLAAAANEKGYLLLRIRCPEQLFTRWELPALGFEKVGNNQLGNTVFVLAERIIPLEPVPPTRSNTTPSFGQFWIYIPGFYYSIALYKRLVPLFYSAYGGKPPFHPFRTTIISLVSLFPFSPNTLEMIDFLRRWRYGDTSMFDCEYEIPPLALVMFDSGGFQAQQGLISFDRLCDLLLCLYSKESWADLYVLPDYPPVSSDPPDVVAAKSELTLRAGERFLSRLSYLWRYKTPVGAAHAYIPDQVAEAARRWYQLGVTFVAFGSFDTMGPRNSMNMFNKAALLRLQALMTVVKEHKMRLHIFGIGHTTPMIKMAEAGIHPTTLDSVSHHKAACYGNVRFPAALPPYPVARFTEGHKNLSVEKIEKIKEETGHECPFCANPRMLYESLDHLSLHNLVVVMELTERLRRQALQEFNTW